jgi:hypothetical protein
MAENQPDTILNKPVDKVGVIIVHGIGEQTRFQFLESETRKIVNAVIANYGQTRRDVTPTLTTGAGDPFLGAQSSWASGPEAPLHVFVDLHDRIVDIAFHECWWADVNETLTLWKQVRFWLWGLSLPGIATHNDRFLLGATERMRPPHNDGKFSTKNRIRILYVSILFGFSAFSVALINMILKRLDFQPLPLTATIVNYLSAVKLYSQDRRAGGSTMDGPDEPPRAAIRRRMIRVMVDVARSGYDRWYILAHSLGTVVAWNGLMEIQQALPNYLDRKCWEALKGSPLRGIITDPFDVEKMMPNRPVWVGGNEIINRDALFEKFRGILTYGSPLERFCALWSAMVPINKTEDPFRPGTEWINVYDPTDPVGTWLSDFNPRRMQPPNEERTTLKLHNFPCRASPILLLSHISYLNAPKDSAGGNDSSLVNLVTRWLVEDQSMITEIGKADKGAKTFWMPHAETEPATHRRVWWRVFSRVFQAGIVGLLLTWLTVLSLEYLVFPFLRFAKGMASKVVKTFLDWLGIPDIKHQLAEILAYAPPIHANFSHDLSGVSAFWHTHLNWTLASNLLIDASDFLIEAALLWFAMFLVVCVACAIHYFVSARERDSLHERFAPRTKPAVSHPHAVTPSSPP